ncbi:MAG: hypothetical protein IT336_10750 [Thermomicrobiales bacterium]|nr:hypothetical protein [Thermomicrobiales bacterium]
MRAGDHDLIRSRLDPGERLLWSGRPRRGIRVPLSRGWLRIVGPIVVIALALLWVLLISALLHGKLTAIFFMVIVSIFTYLLVIERLIDAWRRRNMCYGLSTRRAFVIEGIVRRRIRSVSLDMIVAISCSEHASGIGTIHCISPLHTWHRKNKRGETRPVPLFRMIVDPRIVFDLLIESRGGNRPLTVFTHPWNPEQVAVPQRS